MPSTSSGPGGSSGPKARDDAAKKARRGKPGEDRAGEDAGPEAKAEKAAEGPTGSSKRSKRAKAGAAGAQAGTDKTAAARRRTKDRDDFRFYRQRIDRLAEAVEEVERSDSYGELGRAALSRQFALHFPLHLALVEALADMGVADLLAPEEAEYRGNLIGLLLDERSDDALRAGQVRLAVTLIRDLINREDAPKTGLLAKARGEGIPEPALERRIAACMADHEGRPLRKRSLMADQEDDMPRYSDMLERDERGRFVSDDDRGGSRGNGGHSSRGYSDMPDRDERGRFMSDDDRRYSRSSSRYDDDDRRYSSSRGGRDYDSDHGQGGWFGDREGHAEAARRGWENRDDHRGGYSQGGRSLSRYDDDDRRYSSSRGGRDYDSDHGQGGWFGDREGHAEAARRGWESRDDHRGGYSQGGRFSSRYDDDDRRYSSSRGGRDDGDHGQGGWFGDREGHAEAARRGWENRDDRGGYRSSGRRG